MREADFICTSKEKKKAGTQRPGSRRFHRSEIELNVVTCSRFPAPNVQTPRITTERKFLIFRRATMHGGDPPLGGSLRADGRNHLHLPCRARSAWRRPGGSTAADTRGNPFVTCPGGACSCSRARQGPVRAPRGAFEWHKRRTGRHRSSHPAHTHYRHYPNYYFHCVLPVCLFVCRGRTVVTYARSYLRSREFGQYVVDTASEAMIIVLAFCPRVLSVRRVLEARRLRRAMAADQDPRLASAALSPVRSVCISPRTLG